VGFPTAQKGASSRNPALQINRATARLKTCLKLLGRLQHDTARPPIRPLPPEEAAELQAALKHAGA